MISWRQIVFAVRLAMPRSKGATRSKSRRTGKIVRCILVDDHPIVREGLRSLIEKEPDIQVVADVGDGQAAIEGARTLAPDVVVVDIGLPEMSGIAVTREIRSQPDAPKVLCLSVHSEKGIVAAMLKAGASGYLLKTSAARELTEAIRIVVAGGNYRSPALTALIGDMPLEGNQDHTPEALPRLTSREREVLELIAEGCHTKEIASRLDVSIKTVFTHRERLMRKLRLESNVHLAKFALREGISQL